MPLSARFQIEELVSQDAMGVEFRAIDEWSGGQVALRRFFPFGKDGGGLEGEERAAYEVALERLMTVRHAGLRAVVGGGCDPVDGLPFLAMEWVEGLRLDEVLAVRLLDGAEAVELIRGVLEVSQVLSGVLGEEACWVETAPAEVRVVDGGSAFSFAISPMKWLGAAGMGRRLEPLVPLVEAVMGWQGRVVGDAAGAGLGGWVKWLRANAGETSISEARRMLAAATGGEVMTPTVALAPAAAVAPRVVARPFAVPTVAVKSGGGALWGVLTAAALVVVGLGIWMLARGGKGEEPPVAAVAEVLPKAAPATLEKAPASLVPPAPVAPAAEDVTARAERMARELAAQQTAAEEALAGRLEAVAKRGGVFFPEESDLVALRRGEDVVVEGTFVQIRRTSTGSTFYFEFSADPGNEEVRGYLMPGSARKGVVPQAFQGLIGKKVRMSGTVRVMSYGGVRRPEVLIETLDSIVEVP